MIPKYKCGVVTRLSATMGVVALTLAAHAGAAELPPTDITVDFARQTGTSTHLLFGGCSPNWRHGKAWEMLARAGVTFLRFDVRLGRGAEPKNITLEDYKAHLGQKGSIADINSRHWNWSEMDGAIRLCQANGFKSLAILCYSPAWLGYNGDPHAPPRDFVVWKDLVRQIVRRYHDRVDYWEIWNEPNGLEFMKVAGSPYPAVKDGMLAAYHDICRHTLDAIKETGLTIRVGGPTLATFNSAPFIDKFLVRQDIVREFDFFSHHIYFHAPVPNRCFPPVIHDLWRKHGIEPLPLFITEWNSHSGVAKNKHVFKNSPESVGWVGKTFVLFLQWGVHGANFYNFSEGRAVDDQLIGAYKMVGGDPQAFRFVKVFHLLSKVLGLGDATGEIKVFDSRVAGLPDEMKLEPNFADSLYAVGCINAQQTPVVVIANPSNVTHSARVTLADVTGRIGRVRAFVVRPNHMPAEATEPTLLFEKSMSTDPGEPSLDFPVDAHSVIGLRLEHAP